MSDLQSKTPITDSKSVIFNAGTEDQPEPFEVVEASDMRALELAANEVAEHLRVAPVYKLSETTHEFMERYKVWYRAKHDLIAAFATLQPSPHDAPRTETHQSNE